MSNCLQASENSFSETVKKPRVGSLFLVLVDGEDLWNIFQYLSSTKQLLYFPFRVVYAHFSMSVG